MFAIVTAATEQPGPNTPTKVSFEFRSDSMNDSSAILSEQLLFLQIMLRLYPGRISGFVFICSKANEAHIGARGRDQPPVNGYRPIRYRSLFCCPSAVRKRNA